MEDREAAVEERQRLHDMDRDNRKRRLTRRYTRGATTGFASVRPRLNSSVSRMRSKYMKDIERLLAVVLVMNLVGCASTGFLMAKPEITVYGQTFPPKSATEQIDVFNTGRPNKEYIELAQIKCGDTDDSWNMAQIMMKAREIGADAIIVTGKSGSYGVGIPVGNVAYAVSESYGISAVAIKYK